MNVDYDKGWIEGFYKGIESVSTWESFVHIITIKHKDFYEKSYEDDCSYCSDTGINYITPEMCSPGKYTTPVVKCRRCNGDCGPDYDTYLRKIIGEFPNGQV